MRDAVAYLLAQATRQPLQTAQFAAAEWWRRGRLRRANGIPRGFPRFDTGEISQRLRPFLPETVWNRKVQMSEAQRGRIVAAAHRIVQHEFEILGCSFSAGKKIQWNRDYTTGYEWPSVALGDVQLLKAAPGSDVKRPWELARFHHAVALGQAFYLEQDESLAREFAGQLQSWADDNPYPRGIHWATPLEAGVRAVNLCVAGALFSSSRALSVAFWHQYLTLLFLHGRFLNLHREWNPVARANHHLGCLVGLQFVGALFRSEPEGRGWLSDATECLRREMEWQVGEDGVAQEGSSSYHGLVTEMFLNAALLGARLHGEGRPVTSPLMEQAWGLGFRDKLERMFEFPAALLEGRHAPPVLGDSDDGRLLPLCSASASSGLEHLVAAGRVLFDRADWPAPRHDCDQPAWLLDAVSPPARVWRQRARAFPAGGFYLFESSRVRGSIRCGPLGVRGWANHAHCDQLNVEFCVDGRPVVVDPGTYLYSGDAEARNQLRGSRSHNAPVVDGAEQNRFWPGLLFRMVDDTRSQALLWREESAAVHFTGMHRGYRRLVQDVTVRRTLRLDCAGHGLEITDEIMGTGTAQLEWFWHFAPGIEPVKRPAASSCPPEAEACSAWKAGPVEISMRLPTTVLNPRAEILDSCFAPRYGRRVPCRCLHVFIESILPLKAVFTLVAPPVDPIP